VLQITPTLSIDDRELDERFVRASGPGGQNVNEVATAVESDSHDKRVREVLTERPF
jgi:protein subunit release factor B